MIVRLEGHPNFRDMADPPVRGASGAAVRRGQLWRSGDLATDDADLARLAALGDLVAYDLRSHREASETPDRLPSGWTRVHLPIDEADGIRDVILARMASGDFTPPPGDLMVDAYQNIVGRWTDTLAEFMHRLADDQRPGVVHCTQGKDRTGVAAALVLSAIGVSWQDIEADYLRSNEYRADHNEATMAMVEGALAGEGAARPDVSWLRALLYVDARYLRAARAAWERRSGSTEQYLTEALRLSPRDRAALRVRFLEHV